MKKLLTVLVAIATLLLTACTDKDYAGRMAGIYSCSSVAYVGAENARQPSGNNDKEVVTLVRIDENTLSVKTESTRWGVADFAQVKVSDYDDMANFDGEGTMRLPGSSAVYEVRLSGSFNYDARELAVTLNVRNYGKRLIITFTNKLPLQQ